MGTMRDQKAVTLAMIGVSLLAPAVWTAVVALGGSGELGVAAMLVVGGLGIDQVSRLIMLRDRR
jgi:hypothetical protein